MRKTKQLLALILAIFMLTSLMIPASAETTPEPEVVAGVGYSADHITTSVPDDAKSITTIPSSKKIVDGELVANDEFEKGDDPTGNYTISSVAEFLYFDQLITDYANRYKPTGFDRFRALSNVVVYLTADLDFDGMRISPVGDYGKACTDTNNVYDCYGFAGVFDGLGHTISNVVISPENKNQVVRAYYGLFACIAADETATNGIVRNLKLANTVKFDPYYAMADGSTLTYGKQLTVGGVIGSVASGAGDSLTEANQVGVATVENVYNGADIVIEGLSASAGIVAYAKGVTLTIKNCTNAGDISQKEGNTDVTGPKSCGAIGSIGGIFGSAGEASAKSGLKKQGYVAVTIQNCKNIGDITINMAAQTGGIGSMAGALSLPTNDTDKNNPHPSYVTKRVLTIENCYNEGTLTVAGEVQATVNALGYEQFSHAANGWTVNTTNYVDNGGFAAKMNVKYYQLSTQTYKNTSDKDCYSLRLIALHNAIDTYTDYGYDIEISYADPENAEETITVLASVKNQKKVNTSIKVTELDKTTLDANVTEVTAADLDASYQYVSAVCIDNIPVAYGELTVTVTPKLNNGTVTGAPITFTVTPDYAN